MVETLLSVVLFALGFVAADAGSHILGAKLLKSLNYKPMIEDELKGFLVALVIFAVIIFGLNFLTGGRLIGAYPIVDGIIVGLAVGVSNAFSEQRKKKRSTYKYKQNNHYRRWK